MCIRDRYELFKADVGIDDEVGNRGSVVFEVWGDGQNLYTSPWMTGASETEVVQVKVQGVQQLWLIVRGGESIDCDHANWADARLIAAQPVAQAGAYLSSMDPISAVNGWGPYERDRSNGEMGANDGRTLTLNGQTYAKGLGVHANSVLRYELNGNYSRFFSDVGIDDEVGDRGSVIFRVFNDVSGALLWQSGVMRGNSLTQSLDVDVSGVDILRLVVDDAGDGVAYDHANWAGAKLV
jgi:hypothetical protein